MRVCGVRASGGRLAARAVVLEAFYGFAHGSMTSRGGAVRWSGICGAGGRRFAWARPRAPVRVTAHTSCGRLAAAFEGRLNSKAGPPAGSTARGWPRVGAEGCGPRRFGFVAWFRSGARRVVGWRCCLWSPSVLGPSPHLRPEGSRPVRWCQAGSFLLWSGRVRPDTTGPACLGKPRRCGEGPRTQPPVCGEKDPPKHIASSPDPSPSRAVVRCGAPKCGGRWHRRLPAPPPPPAKRSLLQRPRRQSGLHLPLERQVHRHHRQHRDRHSREQGWEVAAVALRHHQ